MRIGFNKAGEAAVVPTVVCSQFLIPVVCAQLCVCARNPSAPGFRGWRCRLHDSSGVVEGSFLHVWVLPFCESATCAFTGASSSFFVLLLCYVCVSPSSASLCDFWYVLDRVIWEGGAPTQ